MSAPPKSPATPPRKRRGWLKWLTCAAVLGTLTLGGVQVLLREATRVGGERKLAIAVIKTEESDPDWAWERVSATRRQPEAGNNGAELIPRVKKLTRPDWGKEFEKSEWGPYLEIEPNVRYSPRVIAQVRQELTNSIEAIRLARTLKDRPFGHREIVLTPNVLDTRLDDTQDTRTVASLLRWDSVLAAEDGDWRRATVDLLALLGAARSIGDEPFLISQLIRIACDAIAIRATERYLAQTPNPPDLSELQQALAAEADEPLLLFAVRGERAMLDGLLARLQDDEIPLADLDPLVRGLPPDRRREQSESLWARVGWWFNRADVPAARAYALACLGKYAEAARRPMHEQPPLVAAIPGLPEDHQYALLRLLLPAVGKLAHAHWRMTAEARCAVVGIACERFRQKHNRWPDSLTELVPAFLPSVPLDPFDGQPLRYAKSKDGVAVYSVGKPVASRIGGVEFKEPPSTKPGLPDGVEYGFRLWNPDKRRLPPLPDPPPAPENEPKP